MSLKRIVSLISVLLLVFTSVSASACEADKLIHKDVSESLPLSLAGSAGDRMYFLPGNDISPINDSAKQISVILPDASYKNDSVFFRTNPVFFAEQSSSELILTECISPRAP